jgi:hypothetical protein
MNSPIPYALLPMIQGATFQRTFNLYDNGDELHEIEEVTVGYPTVIKVTGHGLSQLSTTPVFIANVKGTTQLNSPTCETTQATYVDADHFSVPISTVADTWKTGTGDITWKNPADFTDLKARMHIRSVVESTTLIHELTTENGGITLTSADGSIDLLISAVDTAAFEFKSAVFDLELVDDTGATEVVTRIVEGDIILHKEVTRS